MTHSEQTLTVIPPAVFSAILRSSRDRADLLRRQNSPANDGRTGYVVDYFAGPRNWNAGPRWADLLAPDPFLAR